MKINVDCKYWANSHWVRKGNTQYPEKLNAWAGILNTRFIEGNLTAAIYEDMLRDQIVPVIRNIAGDNFEHIWLQQDGAAHPTG